MFITIWYFRTVEKWLEEREVCACVMWFRSHNKQKGIRGSIRGS